MALYQEFLKEQLDKTDFTVEIKDAWIDRQGNIYQTNSFCHCQMALSLIHEFDKNRNNRILFLKNKLKSLKNKDYLCEIPAIEEEIMQYERNGSYLQMFNNANKTFGFDEAEFLVVVLGYCAIENQHIIYSQKLINTLQIHALGVSYYTENNKRILEKL